MAQDPIDRKLEEAAARSPEIAAMLARRHREPAAHYRRLVLLVVGAAAAIGLLWVSASSLASRAAPERKTEPAEEIDDAHYLRPMKTARVGPGEETAPFSGFAISVETEPPGAIVTIAGVPRGEAPVLANVECTPGARLAVAAEKEGFRPARAETSCRADTLVKLTVRLER
jgi:hypothetical protein